MAIKKVLVVGSWAKEQITVENIVNNSEAGVYVFMDTYNPGIIPLADGFCIGDFYDTESIVGYALSVSADLVLVTTASPLAAGLADRLEEKNICVFGPTKSAARLESDKAFARRLMSKYIPEAVPDYGVFSKAEDAIGFAREHSWQVAVKFTGLREGLGVKVFGDQLKNEDEVVDYIKEVLDKGKGPDSQVVIEERLIGEEFTIQCLVNNDCLITTPAVQDFKKLLPQDRGPNTASMGSYSDKGKLLPFMEEADYEQALNIIRTTIKGFREESGKCCKGFLYGQFMLTKKGIKLIEYNFRPGDPEWLNTLTLLKGSLLKPVEAVMEGESYSCDFSKQATVCKYVVPPGYPEELNCLLKVNWDEESISHTGAKIYYSCGKNEEGKLQVGSERGIAIIACGDTIKDAYLRIESAIGRLRGEFFYRKDIGSEEQILEKCRRVKLARVNG
ncbi:MAG: phosphoribosylamine--glycine ligase [Candidatus Omnitrophica bacterium]|nr:phosphoribosylamine--glycine ligase [Candidatus Omnitrophota bacterium]MBD3268600.1 phosphoribosylamine--glycine ligase [Candidatus Omnitrophota bacterium]